MIDTFVFILHFLYVGEGDCTVVEYQYNGQTYLYCIDFGGNPSLIKRKTNVVKYLEKRGCKNKNNTHNDNNSSNNIMNDTHSNIKDTENNNVKLNCILTHPHFDHYQDLELLYQNFDIHKFYYNNLYEDYSKVNFTDKYLNTLRYNKKVRDVVKTFSPGQKQQVFSADIIFQDKNICMQVLWPTKNYKDINNDFNDNSMVILITLQGKNKSVLLMADAGVKAEKEIMDKYPGLTNVDIIKIGHHGNNSSSSQDFIDKMNPKIVINSTGPHLLGCGLINCHISNKVMKAWQKARNGDTKIYTTHKDGDIIITYDEKSNDFIYNK